MRGRTAPRGLIECDARDPPMRCELEWNHYSAAHELLAASKQQLATNIRLHRGTLDDYANMARAGIALFEVTGETGYLDEVKSLVAVLDRHFADTDAGGYFVTADDAADLIVRTKHCHDNASPAGNATLVAHRAEEGNVKKIVELLREKGQDRHL